MYSLQIVAIFNKTTKSDSVLAFERKNVLEKSNESLSSILYNSESMSEHCSSNKINFTDAKVGFQVMKSKCPDELIMVHLNINSIRNKFDALSLIFKNNVDILMISETKLDDSFPNTQILLHGFSATYRLERKSKGSGIMLYIREDIPFRVLNSKSKTGIETVSVEINLRKRKWFSKCSYNANKSLISNHLKCLNRIKDGFSKNYDNIIFLGDFNTCIKDNAMTPFCSLNNLTSLTDQPTCYRNRHVLILYLRIALITSKKQCF